MNLDVHTQEFAAMAAQPRYPEVSFNIQGVPATGFGVGLAGYEALFRAGIPHEEAAIFLNEAAKSETSDRALDVALRWMSLTCTRRQPGRAKYIYRDKA